MGSNRSSATRSAVRVALATTAAALLLFGIVRVAITQPFAGRAEFLAQGRAEPAVLERHVRFLTEETFPRSLRHPENLVRASEYIAEALVEAGAKVEFQRYVAQGIEYRNVVGRLGAAGTPRVVVGAHYDAFGGLPGADDNASGVAGLLEVARLLRASSLASPVELVAYSTEEPPFFGSDSMGSARHASSIADARAEVRAMICLEMVGYYSERQPAPSWPFRLLYPTTGDFVLVAGRWEDRPLIRAVKAGMRAVPGLEVQSYCGPTAVGTDLSDHRSYWAVGIPAVMVTDTAFVRNPNYHTHRDTADTLDYPRMALAVDGVVSAVLALSEERVAR